VLTDTAAQVVADTPAHTAVVAQLADKVFQAVEDTLVMLEAVAAVLAVAG
jgi:hypothetical protein